MSDDARVRDDRDAEAARREPVVGIVATEHNVDGVLRTLCRASLRGHTVLVTYRGPSPPPTVPFARRVGAYVVEPPGDDADSFALGAELRRAAREYALGDVVIAEGGAAVYAETDIDALADGAILDWLDPPTVVAAIPAYNEAATIAGVVRNAREHVDQVVVIDDGSADGTIRRAAEAGATVIVHDRNRGYGAALKTAFRAVRRSSVEHLVVLDADGQHDPDDIRRLVDVQRETGAEIVVGNRFTDERRSDVPRYRRVGLRVINALTNLSLGYVRPDERIGDTQSGFRIYSARAVRALADDDRIDDDMCASTDILYRAHRYEFTVEEAGTRIDYRVENGSHLNPVSHGFALVDNIHRAVVRRRPVTLLGLPGLLATIAGVGLGATVATRYAGTSALPPALVAATGLCLAVGFFALAAAAVLYALETYFE